MSYETDTRPDDGTGAPHQHPTEIAVGVVIGRSSEFFDFFVYAIASVLVFPRVMFPFRRAARRRCSGPSCSSRSPSSRGRSAR